MKEKLSRYRHWLLLLYFPIYLIFFYYLETVTPDKIHIIDCPVDHYIPFIELFIIPYLLWFGYLGITGVYFLLKEKESFCRMMIFGIIGMTTFLVVSWLYPNGLELRPDSFDRDNILIRITQFVYSMDTATNVLPSIHVFNSVGAYVAINNSEKLQKKKWLQKIALVLTILIILSTVFVKQHSMVDVLSAFLLSWIAYEFVYNGAMIKIKNCMEEMRYRKKTEPSCFGK